MDTATAKGVEVIYAEAGRAWRLRVPAVPASVGGPALTAGALLAQLPSLAPHWPASAFAPAAFAVFGREVDANHPLRDGDRLELLRALPTDPKLARRARAETTKPR